MARDPAARGPADPAARDPAARDPAAGGPADPAASDPTSAADLSPGEASAPLLTNPRIAAALDEIGDLLDIKGESSFKVGAYRRAAGSVMRSPVDVAAAYRSGRPPRLTGVGASIAERIAELATTGRIPYLEALREDVPPTLKPMLAIPGVGPRTVGEIWRGLGIATLEELEAVAREGRLRRLRGISARTEARILEGIVELERRPPRRLLMGEAWANASALLAFLEGLPAVRSARVAGSLRRRSETVGDIDILVETDRPEEVLATLASTPIFEHAADGPARTWRERATLQLLDGPQVDVMTVPPGAVGTYAVHFTGSAAHNVRLRHRARGMGWSLSEKGLSRLPDEAGPQGAAADDDGDDSAVAADAAATASEAEHPATETPDAELLTFATEPEVYEILGLRFIEPELREDGGEIEAAEAGRLPQLVTRADLRGDCHSHSHWSDGREPLEVMVESGRRLGHEFLVLTDHTRSLTIANGLTPERVEAQRRVIGELNERFDAELARGELPEGSHPGGFRLLHGCELEITVDGRLDYDDDLLATFDVVVASLHVGRRQPRQQLMARYEVAMRSPHVDIIAHPSGRKIHRRPDLDLDWEAFYCLAAESGTLLEVNGSEDRLDLDEHRIRAALDAGCHFTIDSDAHDRGEWQHLEWGIAIARRGWLEPERVANTRPLEAFLELVREKPHRM